jgi:hypothetical protein
MKWLLLVVGGIVLYMVLLAAGMGIALSGTASGSTDASKIAISDIPPDYLALYQQAAKENGLDWAIIAGIGSVETDHGRSKAPGVHSGVNSYGCCAGPMQFSIVGHPSTWDSYGAGGNVYDPADAIPATARYLVASGAPEDYHAAILAYNHSEAYYQDVMGKAAVYRAATPRTLPGGGEAGPVGSDWLEQVPGTTVQCDRRIVADVVLLISRYHVGVTACYAATGHEASGEHPLGLAVDLVPTPPASWGMLEQLARDSGWRPACASTGCASQTHTVFRFVGWNNYPGHGDPQHAGANAHLHLSWNHGPGRPASSVQILSGT